MCKKCISYFVGYNMLMYKHEKAIKIYHIFTSPKHNYFTREKFDIGDSPTIEHESVTCEEGKGLKGDRFEFSTYPITLFSLEVAEEVCKEMDMPLDIKLFRRNIVVTGIHLNSLIGKRFKIDEVEFEGLAHCSPCTWMNAVMKKGTYGTMRGRGGLRVKVISGGELSLGESTLYSREEISENPLTPLKRPKIPSF